MGVACVLFGGWGGAVFAAREYPAVVFTEVAAVAGEAGTAGAVAGPSPEEATYYLLIPGAAHSPRGGTGGRPPDQNAVEEALAAALAVRGFRKSVSGHPPSLFIRYRWGEWEADGLPSQSDGSLNRRQAIERIHARALIVGGSAFAGRLRTALRDSADRADLNRPSHAGRGNPAANALAAMSALSDPLRGLQNDSAHEAFLVELSTNDCFFVEVTAYRFDADTQQMGDAVWRSSATVGARRLSLKKAVPMLIAAVGPRLGEAMVAPEMVKVQPGR